MPLLIFRIASPWLRKWQPRLGPWLLRISMRAKRLVIETKADPHDVVSIADREVEDLIRTRIAAAFPGDAILGEEYGVSSGTSDYTWVIDPIDGTSPFVNGMPTWCISIAALRGEEIAIGVIYVPCNDELYAAADGMGATLNGKALKLDAKPNHSQRRDRHWRQQPRDAGHGGIDCGKTA